MERRGPAWIPLLLVLLAPGAAEAGDVGDLGTITLDAPSDPSPRPRACAHGTREAASVYFFLTYRSIWA